MRSTLASLCALLQLLLAPAQDNLPTPAPAPQQLANAPRLVGHSAVLHSDHLYLFGGMMANATNPEYRTFAFNTQTLVWTEIAIVGEDKPLGRMWHSAYEDSGTQTSQMVVYGGLNCYELVSIKTDEGGSRQYEFNTKSIEFQYAMEDMWALNFDTWVIDSVHQVLTDLRTDLGRSQASTDQTTECM